jgi:hypothetical protein
MRATRTKTVPRTRALNLHGAWDVVVLDGDGAWPDARRTACRLAKRAVQNDPRSASSSVKRCEARQSGAGAPRAPL